MLLVLCGTEVSSGYRVRGVAMGEGQIAVCVELDDVPAS